MQTVAGNEASGLCKEEYQAFMLYFVRPLVERAVRERLARENAMEPAPTYTVRRLKELGGKGTGEQDGVEHTLQEICDFWKAELNGAWVALLNEKWLPHIHAESGFHVQFSAYKPTCWREHSSQDASSVVPFFVTLDNCGVHSHWLSNAKGKIVGHEQQPGVPLLQRPTMPPQGHDAHQVVEHAIGATKGFVSTAMARAVRDNAPLSCKMLHEAVLEGAKLFTADSLARNLIRLRRCMRVVAAAKGDKIEWLEESVSIHGYWRGPMMRHALGTAGGFPPAAMA